MAIKSSNLSLFLLFVTAAILLSTRLNSISDAHLLEFDTVYMQRIAERIYTEGWAYNNVDKLRYFPNEWGDWENTPTVSYALAILMHLNPFGTPKDTTMWYGPIFAVLAVIALAYTSWRANNDIGFAALILTVLPGFLFRTVAGYSDKDTIAIFLMILGLYFIYRSLQEQKLSMVLLQGALAGITEGLAAISMSAFILYLLPFGAFAVIQVFRKRVSNNLLAIVPMTLGYLLIQSTLPRYLGIVAFKSFQNLPMIGASFFILVAWYIFNKNPFKASTSNEKLKSAVVITAVIMLVTIYALGWDLPTAISAVVISIENPVRGTAEGAVGQGAHAASVGEQQPTSWAWPWEPAFAYGGNAFWEQMKWAFPLSLLILAVAVLNQREEGIGKALSSLDTADKTIIGVLTLLAFLVFGNIPMAAAALVLLLAVWITKKDEDALTSLFLVFNLYAASKAVKLFFTSVPAVAFALGRVFQYSIENTKPESLYRYGAYLVIIMVLLINPLKPNDALFPLTSAQAQQIHTSVDDGWFENFKWTQLNTKETSPIISWWDYGYWIQYFARRPSVADGANTGPGGMMDNQLGIFFTEQNETVAVEWMRQHVYDNTTGVQARLVTHDMTMIGKMYWAATIGGRPIAYSILQYTGNEQTPLGEASVFTAGDNQLLAVNQNGTIVPYLRTAGGQVAVFSTVVTSYGTYLSPRINDKIPVISGAIMFTGNAAVHMPEEAARNMFTRMFLLENPPCAVRQSDECLNDFVQVFNNGFVKSSYLAV